MDSRPGSGERIEFPESHPDPLRSPERARDPFAWYDRARREGPVSYDPRREVHDVFSHEHVKAALQDDERLVRKPLARESMATPNPFSYIDNAMVWSDGTTHGRTKHQLFEYFRPDVLADLRDGIEAVTEAQLDAALADGRTFDFAAEVAVPVPLRVVMDLVGVPRKDHRKVLSWLETFRLVMNKEYSAAESANPDAMTETVAYFEDLVAERTTDPREDLVSRLVTGTDLDDATIGANCFDFIMAGQGTMSEFLSNAVYVFDRDGLFDRLDEHDLDALLEEVLRYRSPLQSRVRETAASVTLAGVDIPAGETVVLWLGAANRDPARYDDPHQFVPDRDPDHLAFGSGTHVCIGAPLARLEGRVVIETLCRRVNALSVHTDDVRPKPKASKLGFERLPVTAGSP